MLSLLPNCSSIIFELPGFVCFRYVIFFSPVTTQTLLLLHFMLPFSGRSFSFSFSSLAVAGGDTRPFMPLAGRAVNIHNVLYPLF